MIISSIDWVLYLCALYENKKSGFNLIDIHLGL